MKVKKKKYTKKKSFSLIVVLVIFLGIFFGILYEHPEVITGNFKKSLSKPTEEKLQIILPTDSVSPTIEEPSKENDPIVTCQLYECGNISMRSSQCKISGCCVIGTQKKVMTDQSQCNRLQKEYEDSKTSSSPNSTSYILENAKINAKQMTAQTCLAQAKYEADRCSQDCEGPSNYGRSVCKTALDGLDWTTEKDSECLDEN